ncbi:MAG: hypothetical protein V1725_07435 [archaeon]
MVYAPVYLIPSWFSGFDILFQIAFAIVALLVSIYAFKVYKLSGQQASKIFGIGFLLIFISYFLQLLLNIIVLVQLNDEICNMIQLKDVALLYNIGVYTHLFFFILGLGVLSFISVHLEGWKARTLLLIIIFTALLLSINGFLMYYLLSSILLAFLVIHYGQNYARHRRKHTLLVLIGFVFLLLGSIYFMFSSERGLFYVLGNALALVAFILILTNLLLLR